MLPYIYNIDYIQIMKFTKKLKSLDEVQATINENRGLALFYFTHPDCGVCGVIKPKIEKLLDKYPEIKGYNSSLADDPKIAGQLTLYSVPALLLYMENKEVLREGKYIVMDVLEPKIKRLVEICRKV